MVFAIILQKKKNSKHKMKIFSAIFLWIFYVGLIQNWKFVFEANWKTSEEEVFSLIHVITMYNCERKIILFCKFSYRKEWIGKKI